MKVAVLRIGPVDEGVIEHIRRVLREVLPGTSTVLLREVMSLPLEAYNAPRDQYNSSILLSKLQPLAVESGADRLLGVTGADLYVPSMNFVFGEAHPRWGVAVVSLHRLRPEFYGQAPDEGLFLERCAKEAIHEIGHTLGLGHCDDPRCVMSFSNSILETDRKGIDFCSECRSKVLRVLRASGTLLP